jgi:hypothetical protein
MNEFGGTLTDRSARQSTPARKSSHALACGTRAFIISHFAAAALSVWFSCNTARMTSRSVNVPVGCAFAERASRATTLNMPPAIVAQWCFRVSRFFCSVIKMFF